MPPVRSIVVTQTSVTFTDAKGVHTFTAADIPPSANTPAKLETLMNTWAAAHLTEFQMRGHVFSLGPPLNWTFGTWNLGLTIPANWWVEN